MEWVPLVWAAAAIHATAALCGAAGPDARRQWPQWRGPTGNGVAVYGNPPIRWGEERNIRWKVAVPGLGHATPAIWGDRVFLATAEEYGKPLETDPHEASGAHDNVPVRRRYHFKILALSRRDGSIQWERVVRSERPHEGTHVTGSWASNSPVTDGTHVFAYFGSRGLYCLDMDGAVQWELDLGNMQTRHGHGEGSSPALYGNTIVVNWDHQGDSFIVAIDKRNGEELWRKARNEITSWSTPLVVEHNGKPQVVVSATNRVRSYDLATGEPIWECAGLSRNVVASPVAADGFVYVSNSYDGQAMLAIRLSAAHGDITGTDAVVWTRDRHTPYVPSPLLYRGMLYFLKHNQGLLTCMQAKIGRTVYGPVRLPGIDRVFASPVGAAGRVYIASRNGATIVLKGGTEFKVLARNTLDDSFSASPAVVGNELYLRGERNLYCIAEDSVQP